MAWVKLNSATANVTVRATGKVEWNDKTHGMLSIPRAVELFHDAETGRLGLRRVRCGEGITVIQHVEDGYFFIDADAELDDAGIKPAEDFSAVPQPPTPPTAPANLGDMGIIWVSLP